MTPQHVAVIDIGKTNAKLALVDTATMAEIAVVTRPNTVLPGPPYPHFDIEGHWAFLVQALTRCHADHRVDAISVTTHGASAVLLDADGGLAAPVLDYEHDGPSETADAYAALRPGFAETGSPSLAMGLNVGAQIHWQLYRDPDLKARLRQVLTYPQYWSYRLTDVAATEVTSLGCHTDLWDPYGAAPSSLVDRLGIRDTLAPLHAASDVLGPILPEIARQTGLAPDTPVMCGIHDSNASLLPHLLHMDAPFGVVSTGTWVIVMAVGGKEIVADPDKDMLVNVNAFGDAVPSARFMGGREYDMLTGGGDAVPTPDDVAAILDKGLMILPAVVPDTGPFQGHDMRWIGGPEPAPGSGQRQAAIAFYLALVTCHCLDLVGQMGPVVVEGPFARNGCYIDMLATATGRPIIASTTSTGTSQGAAMLACPGSGVTAPMPKPDAGQPIPPDPALAAYADTWRAEVARL